MQKKQRNLDRIMKVTIIRVFSAALVLLLVGACTTTEKKQATAEARQALAAKGISFSIPGFVAAAKYNKVEEVKQFIAAGMDVNSNVDGTALIAATA